MSAPFLDECFAIWTRTPAALDALLRGLPEAWTTADEGPETWSPHVVVGHLVHCEKVDWVPRVRSILEHGQKWPFKPVDREAQSREKEQLPALSAMLDEFGELRRKNLEYVRGLDLQESHLALQGTHPAFGAVMLRQLLATWTAHDLAHILQISRVMAKRFKQEVGPWAQYLSVMRDAPK